MKDTDCPASVSYTHLEAAPELRIETGEGGIPVSFRREGQGLGVRCAGGVRTIRYDTRNALMRALGLLVEQDRLHPGTDYDMEETPAFRTLGAMLDNSRNAVMKVETVKKACRLLSLMGYNTLMLYTEAVSYTHLDVYKRQH